MTAPKSRSGKPAEREYDKFETLARKLTKVPKREIDEKRAKSNGKGRDNYDPTSSA